MILLIGCSEEEKSDFGDKILFERKDGKGRVLTRVVSGLIPGEDSYFTISKFDTSKKLIEEYGCKTYGTKYRVKYEYDSKGRLSKVLGYSFPNKPSGIFENYKQYQHYSLEDTSVSFDAIMTSYDQVVYPKNKKYSLHKYFRLVLDSATGRKVFKHQSSFKDYENIQ